MINVFKEINWRKLVNIFLPYFIILIVSFASTYVFFFPGLAGGDDLDFHLAMIEDVYLGYRDGQFGLSTNHYLLGGLALDTYGFYGPFSHHAAALLMYCFSWAGMTAISAYKTCVIISSFIGGIYSYYLARKISKNEIIGIIGGIAFVLMPYRIFCALCRTAFSEAVAMAFIPLVFYGLYSIFNDKRFSINPYISLAVGAIILVLCHPYTAVITATIALIYVACNANKLFTKREGFNIWPYIGGTALIIFMGVGFSFFNTLNTISSNLYRVSDETINWTSIEHLMDSTRASFWPFSGLINPIYLNRVYGTDAWIDETVTFIIFGIVIYFMSMTLVVITDVCLKKLPYNKWYRHISMVAVAYLLLIITAQRPEIYMAVTFSLLLYMLISFIYEKKPKKEETVNTFPYSDTFFLVVSLVFVFILIFDPAIWKVMPSVFRQSQFAWRNWSIASFLLTYLIIVVLKQFKGKKNVVITSSIFVISIMTMTMATLEKRGYYQTGNLFVVTEVDKTFVQNQLYSGALNEMVPQVFYEGTYVSEYPNSLYVRVRNTIHFATEHIREIEDYYNPAFLTGDGVLTITEMKTPTTKFDVVVNSDVALVQFPQFYRDGYYANFEGKKVLAQNVDGLIAFELDKGTYTMNISFERFKGYKLLALLFYTSLVLMAGAGGFGIWYRKRLYGEKIVNLDNQ